MAIRWGNNRNSDRLYFGGLQNHCRWWLQPWSEKTLAPWKKSCDQPISSVQFRSVAQSCLTLCDPMNKLIQHIKKQRHYFANKGPFSQSYGFSHSQKAEHWRTDAFELWCWRRFLRVPWTARRSNKSILKAISPEYSLEGLLLKLKLQYFDHLTWRTDFLGKDPDAGKDWRQKEKGTTEDEMVGWSHRLDGHEVEQTLGVGDGQGSIMCCSWWSHRVGHDWETKLTHTGFTQFLSNSRLFFCYHCMYYFYINPSKYIY